MSARTIRRAAIDIGTVTTRLLVADTDGTSVCEVLRLTEVTQLGRGLHATGCLSEDGIARVAATVGSFVREAARLGAQETVAVATSAARDAANGSDLLESLEKVGVRPRIISGDIEARLSFTGATYGIDAADMLVADLGGGSTELVVGSAGSRDGGRFVEIAAAESVDVGSRRVLDKFLASDPPTPAELEAARSWAREQMQPFFSRLRTCPHSLVTLAGTGTTLSAISQRLVPYDAARVHGSRLSAGEIARLRAELAAMPVEARRAVAGMDPARADVIVAGAVILEAIMDLSGITETTVSEHDILYGLVLLGA